MKNRKLLRVFLGIVAFSCLLLLTSCGCNCGGSVEPKTKFESTTLANTELVKWLNENTELATTPEEGFDVSKQKAKDFINSFVYTQALENLKKNQAYQREIIEQNLAVTYMGYIDNASSADKISDAADSPWILAVNYTQNCTSASNKVKLDKIKDVKAKQGVGYTTYEIVCTYVFETQELLSGTQRAPIKFYGSSVGEFFGHFFNNVLVFPLAWLIVQISQLLGGYYFLGLLIVTILVRTIAWPIYAKTNDMSLKMQLMQPELNAIQEKYARRQDERSKQMMQMEMAQLYKKYKVGIGGCLMTFLQFPIFMAIYNAISSIPYTIKYEGTSFINDWAHDLNASLFGINLFEDRTAGTGQLIGVIILVVIVLGTQFLSQWLSQRRQKINQNKAQEDIPEYRRKSYQQTQNSSAGSMKFMMYGMMLMMGLFVFTSKAGLGAYWCIGNLYSMLQQEINNLTSQKRLEKIKKSL